MLSIILYIFGVFILYVVIETAVKRGINSSIVGQFFEKKSEFKEGKSSSLNNDIDED